MALVLIFKMHYILYNPLFDLSDILVEGKQASSWCNIIYFARGHIEDLSKADTAQSTPGGVRKHVREMPGDELNWRGWSKWE